MSDNLIDVVVGTHALIQENVRFQKLGLVIIDEQHKFGVSQRAKLWKNKTGLILYQEKLRFLAFYPTQGSQTPSDYLIHVLRII